jgi:hypothetical protein
MKKLELNQMENLEGGKGCGTAGEIATLVGGAATVALLMMAAPATGGLSLAYGLGLAGSLSSTFFGMGCSASSLFG